LRDQQCQGIILDGWKHFDGVRYVLGDLVVMPNHVHLLLTPLPGHELEDILQSRKRHSARELNLLLNRSGDFWQKHSYDHIVRDDAEWKALQKYIAENPAKAALKVGESFHRSFDW
jgi:REP element-mobilizing transposase RayT